MSLSEQLERHHPEDAEEEADLRQIRDFVAHHPHPFDRLIPAGHLTASAILVSADGARVLMLHHAKLDRWLQPGGHGDPGETAAESVALREALEETGIAGLRLHEDAPRPLDVDVHEIPPRGEEPAHQHLDLRYLVVAPDGAEFVRCTVETRGMRWVAWEETDALGPDHGLLRALRKARRHVEGGGVFLCAPRGKTAAP